MSDQRERAVSHSLSCTALEWERIRDLADDAGTSMSRFIVDRVLGRDGSGGDGRPDGGHALVLDAGQQRAMHDAALRAESLMVRLVGHSDPASLDVPDAARALFEARLEDMVRTGHLEAARALLASIVGPERAARILGPIVERVRRRG